MGLGRRQPGFLARAAVARAFAAALTLVVPALPSAARGQPCGGTWSDLARLGVSSGCDLCLYALLPGTVVPDAAIPYFIESDLPERFCSTGVLYASIPVLPADSAGKPPLSMRTQTASGGFTAVDGSFDVFVWHTVSGCPTASERRIVVYVRNEGTAAVGIQGRQVLLTDGVLGTAHQIESTLGQRVLAEAWDAPLAMVSIAPGTGDVVAYSKRFSSSQNSSDRSTGKNCFGRARGIVENPDPANHPARLAVYIVAIEGAVVSQNRTRAEALLSLAASSGDPFDLAVPPSGCETRRGAGVGPGFTWRAEPLTVDAEAMGQAALQFRMGLGQTNSQACPAGRQTASLLLHPGFTRGDTVGNYMRDYRVAFTLTNSHPQLPRAVDVGFGKAGADIGLAWQVLVGSAPASDAQVDAAAVQTGWAGPQQP